MKTAILFFLLTLLIAPTFGRQQLQSSLSGKVVEEATQLPVPYAAVAVFKGLSDQPFATVITDEAGTFKIRGLAEGSYRLRVGYMGFLTLTLNAILLGKNQDKLLGNIKLASEQTSISEVTITASKPIVEFGADGVTYNVDQSVLAEGSTATDILKNVPLVQVDVDGNASIAGKRNTRIFIDGKPSDYMTANITDLLNVLPSDAIEKIEVMTNPPAKYSADGEGIINVVLKKGYKIGFNGNVGITAGIRGNTNTNANASYRGKTWSVNGSGAYRENIGRNNNRSYRQNFFPDTTFYYNQISQSRNLGSGVNFRTGFDWDITPKQNLRISLNLNTNHSDNLSGTDFFYLDENQVQSRVRNQQNTTDGNSRNFNFNADYRLNIDTAGGKLTLGLSVNNSRNNDIRQFNRTSVFPTVGDRNLQYNDNLIQNEGTNFTLDYDKPVMKKRDMLEAGFQFNIRENDNDLDVSTFDFLSGQFIPNSGLTNQFLYTENIYAAYGAYTFKPKGWSLRAGLRGELTDVNFQLQNATDFDVDPYLSIFPSFSVNKFFRKRYNIGATYSMRISRPRENALNPQINNSDPLNISFGNPALQPAYTNQMDVSFGVFGNSWSFTPRLSYSFSNGVIERFRTVSSNGISQNTFENVGRNSAMSLILIGNYRPTKTISSNANFSLIQNKYTSALNTSLNRNGLSIRSSAGFSMQLPAKIAFESNINYANIINAQGRNRGSVTTSFGARKLLLNNKINFRVSANDPFGRRSNAFLNQGSNFTLESFSLNNSNNVNFSLNYRFTNVKTKKVVVPPPPAAKAGN